MEHIIRTSLEKNQHVRKAFILFRTVDDKYITRTSKRIISSRSIPVPSTEVRSLIPDIAHSKE